MRLYTLTHNRVRKIIEFVALVLRFKLNMLVCSMIVACRRKNYLQMMNYAIRF